MTTAPDLFLQVCAQPTLENALRLLTAGELAALMTWFAAKEQLGEIEEEVWAACQMEAAKRWLALQTK